MSVVDEGFVTHWLFRPPVAPDESRPATPAYLVIDNQSQIGHHRPVPLTLDQLGFATRATISGVEWSLLSESDARRLRNLGVDEGVTVEALHRAPFGDPLAVRIGRMRVALRRAAARAIQVELAAQMDPAGT